MSLVYLAVDSTSDESLEHASVALTEAFKLAGVSGRVVVMSVRLPRISMPENAEDDVFSSFTVDRQAVAGAFAAVNARDEAAAEGRIRAWVERAGGAPERFEARVEVTNVHPAEALVHCASEAQADYLVVSTHALTGLKRFLLGSVAEKIVRMATMPVLVVRPEKD